MSTPTPSKKPQPSVRETWAAQSTAKKALISGVLVLLGLCFVGLAMPGGDDKSKPAEAEAQKPTTAAKAAPTEPSEPKAPECLTVSDAMVNAVLSGPEASAGELVPTGRASAVRSPDFKKLFFIAIEFRADGVGSEIGVWTSNGLEPGAGVILAASEMAQEFTIWPDADDTAADISSVDPSVAAAEYECLG